ncbi:MAG: DUF4340 domain-containing protein, partial [Planctomycetes bacterium]|nr:DUF4340 domain-containing protein [Planctomycetota bacterium]
MSQGNLVKTIIFIAVAAFSVALAAFIRPSNFREPVPAVGDRLFSDLDELSDLHSMELVFYDKSKKKPAALIIALSKDGEWRLDSHKDYPADADDAEKTIHTAALLLKDLKTLGVATELKSEHAYFGVVEPDLDDSDQSDIGLGILIRVKNANDKEVAKLIIGKPVKKTNPDDSTLHFVRVPGQNRVFTALIDPSKFPTEFDKWIKGNLLDLNTSDIRQVEFRDYSFSKQQFSTPLGVMESADEVYSPRYTISLDWNQSDWKWSLASYVEYRNGRAYPTKLLEDEEVNSSKLSDMKNALNDVEIINVESKPKGLRADLHIDDELLRNQSLVSLLQQKGLYPRRVPNDEGGFDRQMLSSDGEVRIVVAGPAGTV